ncbi:pyridoxamine 5'-phosphate oxidase family protein [Methylophaga sp. OBS4]|uniref:pyridoxamine 5'-phosphate oxidase family protein n=1 Tax=Methylophaga sp. OBS4 TaxID=2991935 RepID=UPI00225B1123|nr:pyridoxamine 5'-phosphate oxidase family protein [Methylophaga sp. OBS4]MCX4188250.1 pyridoxamine 5'-phosphate oxidase family protein [Methylophaga sp. OBS4]
MNDLYGKQHLNIQQQFDSEALAQRVSDSIVETQINDEHRAFIESRDMFFLSTVDHRGYPTCSYKGGHRGFVKIIDNKTIAFPSFNGNGMFLSMGNISASNKVGMLFIDFETPHRVRVHGTATVSKDDALLSEYNEAELIVRVTISEMFVNCPRYIHRYQRVEDSHYVPQAGCCPPLPQWKRIDALQDVISTQDQQAVRDQGGPITPEQYGELLKKGKG